MPGFLSTSKDKILSKLCLFGQIFVLLMFILKYSVQCVNYYIIKIKFRFVFFGLVLVPKMSYFCPFCPK